MQKGGYAVWIRARRWRFCVLGGGGGGGKSGQGPGRPVLRVMVVFVCKVGGRCNKKRERERERVVVAVWVVFGVWSRD